MHINLTRFLENTCSEVLYFTQWINGDTMDKWRQWINGDTMDKWRQWINGDTMDTQRIHNG